MFSSQRQSLLAHFLRRGYPLENREKVQGISREEGLEPNSEQITDEETIFFLIKYQIIYDETESWGETFPDFFSKTKSPEMD